MSFDAPDTITPFRKLEKHYKNRSRPGCLPSLRAYPVFDISRPEKSEEDPVWKAGWWSPHNDDTSIKRWKGKARALGERPRSLGPHAHRIGLRDGRDAFIVAEGCVLIPGYLDVNSQIQLAEKALANYTRPPNPLSLDTHYAVPNDLFQRYAQGSDEVIQPRKSHGEAVRAVGGRQLIDTEPGSVIGYEEMKERNKAWKGDPPGENLKPKTPDQLMKELRWANLGWVYQWSTKSYNFLGESSIPFPADLARISQNVVGTIPWEDVLRHNEDVDYQTWDEDYGIVNFYQLNDTLMGHVDRAELDPSRPLVSISLGHAAIFLLGANTRNVQPQPILLRSGDVLVMSGKGRQFYHGVPRILEGSLPAHFTSTNDEQLATAAVKRWLGTGRININVRQVFSPDFIRPTSTVRC